MPFSAETEALLQQVEATYPVDADASPAPVVPAAVVPAKPDAPKASGPSPKRQWIAAPEATPLPTARPRASAPVAPVPVEATPPADAAEAAPGAHGYVFDGIGEHNAAQLNEFGLAMRAIDASQEQVDAIRGFAQSLAAKESARIEAADKQDLAAVANDRRIAWGNDYPLHIQAINSYLDKVSPEVEDFFVNGRTSSGARFIHTRGGLEFLSSRATEGAVGGRPRMEQRADAEHLLKTNRREYFRSPQAQLALRKSLEEPATEPALRPSASIESEIRELEQRMKSDRRGWFKDEGAQARYRTPLAQRDGG